MDSAAGRYTPEPERSDDELTGAIINTRRAISQYYLLRATERHNFSGASNRADLASAESELRREIASVVQLFRAHSAPPEQLLIRLKEMFPSLPDRDHAVVEAVRQQVVRWVIEDYYRDVR